MPDRDQLATLLRSDLASLEGLSEKQMFGGQAFLLNGHMVCGVRREGGMFRVGKPNESAALAVPGASPMTVTGRRMGGMVETTPGALFDEQRRRLLVEMAVDYVQTLAPK